MKPILFVALLLLIASCSKKDSQLESIQPYPENCQFNCGYYIIYRFIDSTGDNIFSNIYDSIPFTPKGAYFVNTLQQNQEILVQNSPNDGVIFITNPLWSSLTEELDSSESKNLIWHFYYANKSPDTMTIHNIRLDGSLPDLITYNSQVIYNRNDPKYSKNQPQSTLDILNHE